MVPAAAAGLEDENALRLLSRIPYLVPPPVKVVGIASQVVRHAKHGVVVIRHGRQHNAACLDQGRTRKRNGRQEKVGKKDSRMQQSVNGLPVSD